MYQPSHLHNKTTYHRAACFRMFIIKSGPRMPSGNPGKFSTSVVAMSCPPTDEAPVLGMGWVGGSGVGKKGVWRATILTYLRKSRA